jgi:hypothetical protein
MEGRREWGGKERERGREKGGGEMGVRESK